MSASDSYQPERRRRIEPPEPAKSKSIGPLGIGGLVLAGIVTLAFVGPKVIEEQQTKDILQLPALTGRVASNTAAVSRNRDFLSDELAKAETRYQLDRSRSDRYHADNIAKNQADAQREMQNLRDDIRRLSALVDAHVTKHKR